MSVEYTWPDQIVKDQIERQKQIEKQIQRPWHCSTPQKCMFKLFVAVAVALNFNLCCASITSFNLSEFVSIFSSSTQIYWAMTLPIDLTKMTQEFNKKWFEDLF